MSAPRVPQDSYRGAVTRTAKLTTNGLRTIDWEFTFKPSCPSSCQRVQWSLTLASCFRYHCYSADWSFGAIQLPSTRQFKNTSKEAAVLAPTHPSVKFSLQRSSRCATTKRMLFTKWGIHMQISYLEYRYTCNIFLFRWRRSRRLELVRCLLNKKHVVTKVLWLSDRYLL